jgi:hypothetical protein
MAGVALSPLGDDESLFSFSGDGGRYTCVDCGKRSPETASDETGSLTMKYGWRLGRSVSTEGATVVQPRCPPCNALFKSRRRSDPVPR